MTQPYPEPAPNDPRGPVPKQIDPRELQRLRWFKRQFSRPWLFLPAVLIIGILAVVWTEPLLRSYDVLIVDVVVKDWSGEKERNPEPDIAVNPVDPEVIAVTSTYFGIGGIVTMCAEGRRQAVMSLDGGKTWSERCPIQLPLIAAATSTTAAKYSKFVADQTVDFSGDGISLLTAFLTSASGTTTLRASGINDWRLAWPNPSVTDLMGGVSVVKVDQPRGAASPAPGSTTFLVGVSQESGVGGTGCSYAVVWTVTTAATGSPECVGPRPADADNTWAVRTAVHASGVAYAAHLTPALGGAYHLAISRADGVTGGTPLFTALKEEPSGGLGASGCPVLDGLTGVRVRCNLVIPIDEASAPTMGWERRGPYELAIAIDPKDAQRVFVAYGATTPGALMMLHLVRSTDGGRTVEQADLVARDSAANPAVAVDKDGRVGFLYQHFVTTTANDAYWQTVIEVSDDQQTHWKTYELSNTPAYNPTPPPTIQLKTGDPYIGDYVDLVAVGSNFYGVFSANNDPKYHPDAKYQRDVVYDAGVPKSLKNGASDVAISIDPFFFKLTRKLTVGGWVKGVLENLVKHGKLSPTPPPNPAASAAAPTSPLAIAARLPQGP